MRSTRVRTYLQTGALTLVLCAWLGATGLLVWLMLVFPDQKQAAPSRDVPIAIRPGSSIEVVTRELVRARVVENARAFVLYARVMGADRRLRSGWVVGNRALSARELLPRIAKGFGQAAVVVPVPEGFTKFDVATRLERYGVAKKRALLAALHDRELLGELGIEGDSAEGYLFPAHYGFVLDTPPERVITRMVNTFQERTAGLMTAHPPTPDSPPSSPLTPRQIVILASIVEREARVPEERATIAGVFVNRLFAPGFTPRRLQADPTVAYGCLVAGARVPSCREFDGRRITSAMVRDPENPYSTYRHEGLPPGPICNPGLASLEAAARPERHDYLYFVARGGGRHAFSRSLDEHNRNVHPGASPTPAP